MIIEYKFSQLRSQRWKHGSEVKYTRQDDFSKQSIGSKAISYLQAMPNSTELVDLIKDKISQFETDSIDIYVDNQGESVMLNILLFDEDENRLCEPFSIEAFMSADAVEFGLYMLDAYVDRINLFTVPSYQRCDDIDELDEHYEIGTYVKPTSRYQR
jgi:hypothetical protein